MIRPRLAAIAVLVALLASFTAVVLAADGAQSLAGRVGGDFPAFYGAGSIVADGDLEQLYDVERQQEAERGLVEDGKVLYFAYPPPVAALYSLLALLPYVSAYVLHTVLMVAAMALAYWIVRPMLSGVARDGSVVAAVSFTFLPVFVAVSLGQNSALIVLLVAAVWRTADDGRDVLAGSILGLLLFKPQYAVPLIGLMLIRRRPRIVVTALGIGVVWWLAGAAMLGVGWASDWLSQVGEFTAIDAEVNGRNAVSWLGVAEHALGVGEPVALVIGGSLALLTAMVLVLLWWGRTDERLGLSMAAAAAGILLVSPHAMFYDASLLVLVAAGLAASGRDGLAQLVAIGWLVAAFDPVKEYLGFTPVFMVVVSSFALTLHTWWTAGPEHRMTETDHERLGPGRAIAGQPELSVVIPAFDEAGRIEPTLERLDLWLGQSGLDAEVVVVDDGSDDDTVTRCPAFQQRLPGFRVLRLAQNRGKGYAVRQGMLETTGSWRVFLDADGSTDPAEISKLLASASPVAIASLGSSDALVDRSQSGVRSSLGRLGNVVIQRLVLPGINDSQRGCKLFRGDVAEAVFRECTIDGWGFDVEVLARCRAMGHEPVEVGVRWEHRPVGHVRPWHYLTTIGEVLRVRRAVGRRPAPRVPLPGALSDG